MEWLYITITVVFLLIFEGYCDHLAYRRGVIDTFYELNEPGHPGAAKVREAIKDFGLRLNNR